MDELRFDDRVALVTGGGRGIGRCHSVLLAQRGAKVVVADYGSSIDGSGSSSAPAEEVVEEIREAGGEAVACYASVAEQSGAASIVEMALETFGRLDIVMNNAGIADKHPFGDLSVDQFHRMLDVHFLGTLYVIQSAWPHLVRGGYGRIVNTTSEAVLGGQDQLASYGAAKGAVWALTRAIACESESFGILTNAVAPRARTRMSEAGKLAVVGTDLEAWYEQNLVRMDPELVAVTAAYLAHESCSLNGEVLVSGAGDVQRLVPVLTRGISEGRSLTIESVAKRVKTIVSLEGSKVAPIGSYAKWE